MQPDDVIASLQREAALLHSDAPDYEARKRDIETQIEYTRRLPRLEAEPQAPEVVLDHRPGYLAGLRRELDGAPSDEARDAIKTEIKRVQAQIAERETKEAELPTERDIEVRKELRGARRGSVERARAQPTPDQPAPVKTAGTEQEDS